MRTAALLALNGLLGSFLMAGDVRAWGPDGHHTVGAIADRLLVGTNAATQVKAILGTLNLQNAAVWADCAKGVNPKTFVYQGAGHYPECAIYETPAGKKAMVDFVRRNSTNCAPKPGEETCHKQYHYSDVSIAHDHYDSSFVGARTDDIVGAVKAATHVLKGDTAPAPFDLKDTREALLVLAHYVGDIHQPLHVGAVYLDAHGTRVDPDAGTFDPATFTRGGNQVKVQGSSKKLHPMWDAIPASLTVNHVSGALLTTAGAVPASTGAMDEWPKSWASETVQQAQAAFVGLRFSSKQGKFWTATVPANYGSTSRPIKQQQLARAGARLAQLLIAIWP